MSRLMAQAQRNIIARRHAENEARRKIGAASPCNEGRETMDMEKLYATYGRYFCRRCADQNIGADASERYSMGVYAGTYCDPCWSQDGRNHDRSFDPNDAGERMDADY